MQKNKLKREKISSACAADGEAPRLFWFLTCIYSSATVPGCSTFSLLPKREQRYSKSLTLSSGPVFWSVCFVMSLVNAASRYPSILCWCTAINTPIPRIDTNQLFLHIFVCSGRRLRSHSIPFRNPQVRTPRALVFLLSVTLQICLDSRSVIWSSKSYIEFVWHPTWIVC